MHQQFGDRKAATTWDRYVEALENLPPDVVALGITDYYTIDGYKRLLEEKCRGRLGNIQLLLPVVEMRLDKFAGSRVLQKVNFHVVFSDALCPGDIDKWFLERLLIERQLQAGRPPFRGSLSNLEDLERFGTEIIAATPEDARSGEPALDVGFANATVTPHDVWNLLDQSVFRGKYLTALGVGEWSQMRWDGGGTADKRDAIERVDFVLTATPSLSAYERRLTKLREAQVNDRLFDASDAHYYADSLEPNRLGETMTWIKAFPSFDGMRRAIRRFDQRVHVGERPAKLCRIEQNKTRYISGIEIRRKDGVDFDEVWFDVDLPLNPHLVAIIGNQGSGKSALTDTLALAANVSSDDFSFLTRDKFCDRAGRAAAFEVRLKWADGEVSKRDLADIGNTRGLPRVQYVPQGFFDRVTNETNVLEDGQFYGEIKKVVFSHVPDTERLDCATLDAWVTKHSGALKQRLIDERARVGELNVKIADLEAACSVAAMELVKQELELQQKRMMSHDQCRPDAVTAPEPSVEQSAIESLRVRESALISKQMELTTERGHLVQRRVAVSNAQTSLLAAERAMRTSVAKIVEAIAEHGLVLEPMDLLMLQVHAEPLAADIAAIDVRIDEIDAALGRDDDSGLKGEITSARNERAGLESVLESAGRAYETYRNAEAEWQATRDALLGDGERPKPGSLKFIEQELTRLQSSVPEQLQVLYQERRAASMSVLKTLGELEDVYRRGTRPVQETIASEGLMVKKYRIDFDVRLQCVAFASRFFELVKHSGSFAGEDDGGEVLRQILARHDMDDAEGPLSMVDEIVDHLRWNMTKQPPKATEPAALLKARKTLPELYDFLFGFTYLEPAFSLSLSGKPLRQLSPGERGILLLIFYLVLDRSETPLVIDQPEGNLNNQSIFEHLVPVFTMAKGRRQVIIVTHNPNLAVVCDAEQIIHCTIDAADGNRVTYRSGPLEDPQFNHFSLDLLDGTAHAFRARHLTYADGGGL